MTGIVGIGETRRQEVVEHMLDMISHRGPHGREIIEPVGATLGVVWSESETKWIPQMRCQNAVWDTAGRGHFARADVRNGKLTLMRDRIGVVPLYYGRTDSGVLCFASEVKALLPLTKVVNELPPATYFDGVYQERYGSVERKSPINVGVEEITSGLQQRLAESVKERLRAKKTVGAWLSGGLDSSIMSAVAKQYVEELYTFAAGFRDAEDLAAAEEVADFIGSEHREVIVTIDDIVEVLPDVIYHLESFDSLLVRSSLLNFIASRESSKMVDRVFSGEGADELFAGYRYIKSMTPEFIAMEIVDMTRRLHNTALQRVDRCASAYGTTAFVGFLDPQVVQCALRIPPTMKVFEGIEKWILRRAMKDRLPESIVNRTKSKFWQGGGIGEKIADIAENTITNAEFLKERELPNGWILNTKEELLYYRIFKGHFGTLYGLSWMGRTKGIRRASIS
ncbi:MAG: asparagine synthase-related protein [Candidatus Thorarchaeota archaeon]